MPLAKKGKYCRVANKVPYSVNNQRLPTCIYTIKVTVAGLGGPEPPLKTQDINLFCINYYFCFIIG